MASADPIKQQAVTKNLLSKCMYSPQSVDTVTPHPQMLLLSTVREIMFVLQISLKVNTVHTFDCPPISLL